MRLPTISKVILFARLSHALPFILIDNTTSPTCTTPLNPPSALPQPTTTYLPPPTPWSTALSPGLSFTPTFTSTPTPQRYGEDSAPPTPTPPTASNTQPSNATTTDEQYNWVSVVTIPLLCYDLFLAVGLGVFAARWARKRWGKGAVSEARRERERRERRGGLEGELRRLGML